MSVPSYKIAYKDQSWFMKLIGLLLFFNKQFSTQYTTTIGNVIYYPSKQWVKTHPVSAKIILMHELIHLKDSERITKLGFALGYTFPQILSIVSIPIFFFNPWVGLAFLIFLLPLPAYFRMMLERKAYVFSLYALYRLDQINNYKIKFDLQIQFYSEQFSNRYYYYMWPFKGIKETMESSLDAFRRGEKPQYDLELYRMIDDLIDQDVKVM